MTRADKLLLAGILLAAVLAAALLWWPGRDDATLVATLRAPGQPPQRIALSTATSHTIVELAGRLGPTRIEVDGRRLRVLSAPCPNQVCVRQGWIDRPGASLVCVPGEIVVGIEGEAPLDAVTR